MAIPSDLNTALVNAVGGNNVQPLLEQIANDVCASNATSGDQFVSNNLAAIQAKFGSKIDAGLLGKAATAVIQGENM